MAMIEDNEPLERMVLMPNSESVQLHAKSETNKDDLEAIYTERWKGPWESIKNAASGVAVFGATFTPGNIRPALDATVWYAPNGIPSTYTTGGAWTVEKVEVEELDAGDHGILKVTYKSSKEAATEKELTENRRWTLSWNAYTFNVLNYISPANRLAVLAWKKHPVTSTSSRVYFSDTRASAYSELPDDENVTKVADYFQSGINPQFHTPIVNYHQEYELEEDEGIDFDINIDQIQELDNDCPFKAKLTEWQFLLVSDTVVQKAKGVRVKNGVNITTKIYSRERSWAGAKVIDTNFYGNQGQRWIPWDEQHNGGQNGGNN